MWKTYGNQKSKVNDSHQITLSLSLPLSHTRKSSSNKFDKIEPSKVHCTTTTWFRRMPLTQSNISTKFPKEAFSKPPIVCPTAVDRSSVDFPAVRRASGVPEKKGFSKKLLERY